jgi:hypothetical protein
MKMENFEKQTKNRRAEQRLRYHWPVWFAENFEDVLIQGQMVDVSSQGAAFTCYSHNECPFEGERLTARFSVPKFSCDESFDMASFGRNAKVCRIDRVNNFLNKIAVKFDQPLPFNPGEQSEDSEKMLRAVTI